MQKAEGLIGQGMTIAQIFEKYPGKMSKLAETMTGYGLHCVGCHANVHESIGEGAMGHGMSKETVDMLLRDLNKVVSLKEEIIEKVSITENAAKKVAELLKKEKKNGYFLRLKVVEGGCAAFSYDLSFVKDKNADDVVIEKHGAKVVVDKESMGFIKGAEIDFIDGLQGTGFKVNNPNVKKSCGCGNSFA